MGNQTLESMLVCTKAQEEKKPRPQQEEALKCPRCDSTNTKFCYYNNYSLSQPRYFCKSCRRYWTKGGTLRNVPVGGGCRKTKRSSPSSSKRAQDQPLVSPNPISLSTNPVSLSNLSLPILAHDANDLTLAFARLQKHEPIGQLGFHNHHHDLSMFGSPSNNTHLDVLGNPNNGYLDHAQNGYQNLYYGMGNGNFSASHDDQEMAMPYENVGGVSMKQEISNGMGGERRVLWGFPWQVGGDNGNMGNFGLGSSWNGLINSPLM